MKEIKIKYEQNGNRIIAGCTTEQFYGSGETKEEAIRVWKPKSNSLKEQC